MVRVVKTTLGHLVYLGINMREMDRKEIRNVTTQPSPEVLEESFRMSKHCYTALDDKDRVVAIFGVTPNPEMTNCGVPWLLATDLIEDHLVSFVKLSKKYIPMFMKDYGFLSNIIAAENTKIIDWLERVGFTVLDREITLGPEQVIFKQFIMENTDYV